MTTTAWGIFFQCFLGSQAGMFSWLLRPFQKKSGDQGETNPRQKGAGLLSSCKTRRMKSFVGRHGESWAELGSSWSRLAWCGTSSPYRMEPWNSPLADQETIISDDYFDRDPGIDKPAATFLGAF